MIVAFSLFVSSQDWLSFYHFSDYGILDDLCGKSTFLSFTACYYTVPLWCCSIGHPILSAIALWTNVPLCRRPVCLCTFSHRTNIPSLSAIMPSFIPSCLWLWPSWHCAVGHRALSYTVPLCHWPSCLTTILPPCLWPRTFVPWYHRTIMPLCHCAFGHRAMVPLCLMVPSCTVHDTILPLCHCCHIMVYCRSYLWAYIIPSCVPTYLPCTIIPSLCHCASAIMPPSYERTIVPLCRQPLTPSCHTSPPTPLCCRHLFLVGCCVLRSSLAFHFNSFFQLNRQRQLLVDCCVS
jgi:hypothetical protein